MNLVEVLVSKSTLTGKQLESLRSYLKVARGEMLLREAASLRSTGAVTVGSYYRTVQQGREKMKESMVTVLIGLWLGLIELDDVRRLFDLVGSNTRELSESEANQLVQVLQTLIAKIVM